MLWMAGTIDRLTYAVDNMLTSLQQLNLFGLAANQICHSIQKF